MKNKFVKNKYVTRITTHNTQEVKNLLGKGGRGGKKFEERTVTL